MRTTSIFTCVAVAGLAAGCGGNPVKPITTTLDPFVTTLALTQGLVDPNNSCSPPSTPAPPMPDQWWRNLPVGNLPRVASHGIVGTNAWRNTTGACQELRQDLYRSMFTYPLTNAQSLKGLVTKAELTIFAAVLPATTSTSLCQPMTGGGGSLHQLRPGFTAQTSDFNYMGPHTPTNDFPSSSRVFAMTFPWVPGSIATGVTTSDGGGQRAAFTVDVTDRINGAINRGDTSIGFMISGSDETLPTVSPPASTDCRTTYRVGVLSIEHL